MRSDQEIENIMKDTDDTTHEIDDLHAFVNDEFGLNMPDA